MKKLLFILTMFMMTLGLAQEKENKYSYYLATGLSVTNSDDFANSSFVSVEAGVMRDNISAGVVIGRNNLEDIGKESFNDYWYEGKVAVSFPFGAVDGYVLGGVGSYIDGGDVFVEYGAGVSKQISNIGVFLQVSNWDAANYISTGVSFPLN